MTNLLRDAESELAALADGSLTAERSACALARVRDSSELRAALAEQRRAIELTAAVDVQAPASLHRRVEAMVPSRRARGLATRRIGFAAAAAAALAAGAVAIGLSGGGSSGLSVQGAAALTLSHATMPAPAESTTHRAQLDASVGGIPFPYWEERFGWRGSGARSDRLAGRAVTTVFYSDTKGRRIGYTIVSGRAPATHGGTLIRRWGVPYRLLSHDGATVVTWQRGGHLCVVSGRGVSARTLLHLASWSGERPSAA
jgi:hypothetical protein